MSDSCKILIVEDDTTFRQFLEKLLNINGYETVAASDGYEALTYMDAHAVDLILLDIYLPDVDGYWMMDRIKIKFPDTPIIMMTGSASVDSAIQAIKRGAYDYLEKPFATEKLLNTIKNVIERRRLETNSKKALAKLGESEEKYHRLFNSVTDALMIFDAGSRKFEDANRATLDLFGYSLEEFCNLQVEDISAEKDKTINTLERFKKGGQVSAIVPLRYLRKKDGTIFPGEISAAFFTTDGRQKMIGSIRDITPRFRAEKKLRESEERFRNLVENSPIGIAIIQNHEIVYQNQVQDKLSGPISGKTIYATLKYIHPDDIEKIKTAYESVLCGDIQAAQEDFRYYPSGKIGQKTDMRWLQSQATPFFYQGKNAILVNSIDITDAKQLEHQLIIKNKMLSLGRVAAGIAHEIRNPLTGINSYLFTLEDLCRSETIDAEDHHMMLQIIEQLQVASNKIESVIKRVMDFSKPGAPKMVLTDINECLDEAIQLSSMSLRKNGIKLEKSLGDRLPRCHIDPQLIEQVILNLITNAARAMEKANGNKLIEVESFAKNNMLCISVSDSGPGVAFKLRDKIFDPFFTTKEDGHGIGLNIAQRIVADHNGSLSLDTSKWGGAKFKIELPVEKRVNPR